MAEDKKIAAFFDFDGTLYDGAISFDFLSYALRHRALKLNEMAKLPKFLYYYTLDKFKLAERYDVNVRIYKKVKGWNYESLLDDCREFYKNKIRKKLIRDVVKILYEHKKNGHVVVIVTSAAKEFISPVREWLEVDDIIATEVGADDGRYNGIIKALPVGKARIKIIERYSKIHNIDLSKSYAYSDHYSDIPMLKGIGHPIATNPERKLRRYAKKHHWEIIDY